MTPTVERAEFLERHYTLAELARAWHVSRTTLEDWFRHEPGIIRYGSNKIKKGRKRTHVSLRVPESVARRVYRLRTGRELYEANGKA
jgi:AraC-like DNA-binding protein